MKNILLSTVAALAITTTLGADELSDLKTQLKLLSERLSTLEANDKKQVEQTDALTSELINVQNQTSFAVVDPSKAIQGMSPAASKVYYSKNPLSIGGYGELYYSKDMDKSDTQTGDKSDSYRFIPYIGYKFSDNIILNSELEFEHGDEIKIEQLYVDFVLDPLATIRVGHQLVPMGYVNLYHEPTLFNTVQRPDVEKQLIPSTWHEKGLTVYGSTGDIDYTVGVVAGLDMGRAADAIAKSGGKDASDFIREARVGNESDKGIDNMAAVARLDYKGINGLSIGTSLYTGKAGVGAVGSDGDIFMFDVHGQYQNGGFKARALYTQMHLSHADDYVKTSGGVTFNPVENARGGYVNLEYNILPIFAQTTDRLPVFFQYENYNLAAETVNGDSFGNTESMTYGINYFPHDQVVLKAEYMLRQNRNSVNSHISEGVYSFGLGFIF
jgi:hypothetical protein